MTSLQKQLAAIAVQSTHQLDLKAQKTAHGKSLLFEPKVAASQTFDSIFQICYEGFQELCLLDSRFVAFSRNLFSEQSKSEERNQMTTKENQELDSVIESFLTLVSSRLLLKPALKAVEWPIRRFRIHEYNTDFVILTFLPYHMTPLFPTLLSILPAQLSPTYRFLHPYTTSLASPPRNTIVYTATNTPTFFSALQQYILKSLRTGHHSSGILSFWASVTTQAIDGMLDSARSGRKGIQRQREEELILLILPILNECLTFINVPEAILGCYMITTVLVTKANLEDKVLDALMEAIASSRSRETIDGCLVCLAVIAEERQAARLPRAVTKCIMKHERLVDKFVLLADTCRIERLGLGCALAVIDRLENLSPGQDIHFVEQILECQILDESQNSLILKSLLSLVERMEESSDTSSKVRNDIGNLIIRLSESPTLRESLERVVEENNVNIEALEMVLKTTLRPAKIEASVKNEEQDVEMVDTNSSQLPSLDIIFSQLPAHTPDSSFLAATQSPIFENLSQVFIQAVSWDEKVNQFRNLPILDGEHAFDRPLYFSFWIRIWCSPYPALVRSIALQSASKMLGDHSSSKPDMQALIPYIIYGLSDPSITVRRSAAECAIALVQGGAVSSKHDTSRSWASDSFYGSETCSINWLSAKESSKFLSSILVSALEECVLDASHVLTAVCAALDGSSRSKRSSPKTSSELKPSYRSSIIAFLSSHAATTPLLAVRLRLLSILNPIGKAGSASRVKLLLPAVRKWCSLPEPAAIAQCLAENLTITQSDRLHLAVVSKREPEGVDLLKSIINGSINSERSAMQEVAFERLTNIWSALKPELQQSIAITLLDLALNNNESVDDLTESRQSRSLETLRAVKLPSAVLISFMESIPSAVQMPDKPPAAKRRRTSRSEMVHVEAQDPKDVTKALRRLTLVLELIEASTPGEHPQLLKGLFHILGELQHFKMQSGSNLVYLQSLVIGSLLSIVDKLKETKEFTEDISSIRADLLVDCIRHTMSPQVQNAALLLISSLASWVPELVLHNLMPIFTFMGSTLLRQSDDYSAHVIDQTVSRVVPQLAASLRRRNRNFVMGVADLLLSFTAAFEHIPLHRRLGLFSQLAKTLGPEDSLFAVIALLVDRYPSERGSQKFCSELIALFDPLVTVQTAKSYLDLVGDALQPRRTISDALLSLKEKNADQVEAALLNLLSSLAELLNDQRLHIRIGKALRHETEASALRLVFTRAVEKTVQISHQVKGRDGLHDACSRVLSSLLNPLPTIDLIQSAEILLENPNNEVQRTALKSVEMRVRIIKQGDDISIAAMLAFLARIGTIIQHSQDVALKHTAVACIDRISERFGKKDSSAIVSVAHIVAGAQCLGSSDDRLRVLSLLCLASTVDVISDDFIPLLPAVIPKAFSYLSQSLEPGGKKIELHNAVYALLCSIVETLPFMISGEYLENALKLSQRSAAAGLDHLCDESRTLFYQQASKLIEAKEFFGAVERTWAEAFQTGYEALHEQLDMLSLAINSRPKSIILKNTQVLFSIFEKAFDLRRNLDVQETEEPYEESEVEGLEGFINEAAISMTLKLNDAAFRPFFSRLVEWASKTLPKRDLRGKTLRSTTLYLFLGTFFDRLKSIVTSYSSYILQNAADILDAVPSTDDADLRLVKAVLGSLAKSFEHDQDDFWQAPSHFNTILAPLMKQLTNPSTLIVTDNAIPTITELAASAASAEHHKEMNAVMLKYMRSDDVHTRLAAVKCEQSLTERLGEEWLGLLPEMLPFISELQEDDDEVVERETQRWIAMIEEILGESLDPMLQ
ncbi:hypothetical protein K432DRAFT_386511 [Lepidopterella palustris CBS 459.81]|uniref:U3 small nucleolar RNA-associated protein 10 n=1 Tax=Lepidopterella palustris CBS 459.81 TaxID=1314670 RepID=A0A8E2JA55_9PEZI|nr:hypothetical protein K432DRAFT_386511 [Lepidopterella palustris CBS 459.81]